MDGDGFLTEEQDSGFGEDVCGDEDGGMWRPPHSPSTPEESRRSPSEEINPSDTNQDLRRNHVSRRIKDPQGEQTELFVLHT